MLKIYFDYSNGGNATAQKGCKYPFIVYSYMVITGNLTSREQICM